MPRPANPNLNEFYVYRLEVEQVPFYVGLGRSARASDRVRYIRNLMRREAEGESVRWSMSNLVVAEMLRRDQEVSVFYAFRDLVRSEALRREREEILKLVADGFLLANIHYNVNRPTSAGLVVKSILDRLRSNVT